MNYRRHPNSITIPSRLARKKLRNEVFIFNKKAARVKQKSKRLERKSPQVES